MCEIVLHPLVIIHHNRGANRQWRNSKHGTDHPLGARELVIKSNQITCFVGHSLEGAQNHLHLKRDRWRRIIRVANRKRLKCRCLAYRPRDLAEEGRFAGVACGWALRSLVTELRDDIPHLLEASKTRRLDLFNLLSAKNHAGAVQANHVCQLFHPVEELVKIHRASQRDVSKVSRAELVRVLTGRTDLAVLDDSETDIKDSIRNRLSRLIGLVGCNLHDTPLQNVVGVCDAKLNSDDRVAHCAITTNKHTVIRFLTSLPCRLSHPRKRHP